MQEDLLEIWRDRRPSVLFVTHSIDETLRPADRVLAGGRIAEDLRVDPPRPRPSEAAGDVHAARRRDDLRAITRDLVLSDPELGSEGGREPR